MKLEQGMLLAAMLAMATGAGAVEQSEAAGDGDVEPSSSLQPDSGMSGDDEWACKVAMCLANPGGATEFAECVEPIERLRRHLAQGKAFPVCPFTGAQDGSTGSGGNIDQGERDPRQVL